MSTTLSRVRVFINTTGQGSSIELGDAFSAAFNTEVEAGAVNGETYSYIIEKGGDFERNSGAYNSGTRTIGRGTPRGSKIGGIAGTSKMDLDGSEVIRFVIDGEDFDAKAEPTLPHTWTAPQRAAAAPITDNSAADFSAKQRFTADVNGSAFDLVNPSAAPSDGTYITILFTYTTSHGVNLGTKFKATGWTPTADAGKADHTVWLYDETADEYWLVGVRTDISS